MMKTSGQNNPNAADTPAAAASPPALAPVWRWLISAAIVFHLTAVVTGPWSFAPLHSPLADDVFRALRPYIEMLGLANGYRFFAPEPGPSNLIHYKIELADGSQREGVFPERTTQWPRLRYHRHFMLSEFLNSIDAPGAPPELAKAYAESYAEHLAHEHQARQVTISMRRHRLPTIEESQRGLALNDPSLYKDTPLVTYTQD
jgi:hypothetical protein